MKVVSHSSRAHAMLSASGSSRWMNCPPSAVMGEGVESTSKYADEGTLAHELSEASLRCEIDVITEGRRDEIYQRAEANELYTKEMPRQVRKYTELVMECYLDLVAQHGKDEVQILIEERLDFSDWVPHGFGTGDTTIVAPGKLVIIDLKYGKGVEVSAEENSQLKLYGLAALNKFELDFGIETVELIIAQPRLNNYSRWEISADDLIDWADNVVAPLAQKAIKGEGDTKVGDWCRWCKVKASCRALSDHHLQLAKDEFKDPNLMDDSEILEVFTKLDQFTLWTNAIKEYVFSKALQGQNWPGYKLVAGRSKRQWTDVDKAIEALEAAGFDYNEITNTKIKGFTDLSNMMSVDEFNDAVGAFVEKPVGKPTLVPNSDRRAPYGITAAQDDFAEDLNEDEYYF